MVYNQIVFLPAVLNDLVGFLTNEESMLLKFHLFFTIVPEETLELFVITKLLPFKNWVSLFVLNDTLACGQTVIFLTIVSLQPKELVEFNLTLYVPTAV